MSQLLPRREISLYLGGSNPTRSATLSTCYMNDIRRERQLDGIAKAKKQPASGFSPHREGSRLEIKQSAAQQTWSGARQLVTRGAFDIAPRTGYYYEGETI